MRRLALVVVGLGLATACEVTEPCDDYVDYMCDCHPEVDCGELATALSGADQGQQDQCAIDLQDQRSEDGGTCAGDTGF